MIDPRTDQTETKGQLLGNWAVFSKITTEACTSKFSGSAILRDAHTGPTWKIEKPSRKVSLVVIIQRAVSKVPIRVKHESIPRINSQVPCARIVCPGKNDVIASEGQRLGYCRIALRHEANFTLEDGLSIEGSLKYVANSELDMQSVLVGSEHVEKLQARPSNNCVGS